jgi:hypothetical protein
MCSVVSRNTIFLLFYDHEIDIGHISRSLEFTRIMSSLVTTVIFLLFHYREIDIGHISRSLEFTCVVSSLVRILIFVLFHDREIDVGHSSRSLEFTCLVSSLVTTLIFLLFHDREIGVCHHLSIVRIHMCIVVSSDDTYIFKSISPNIGISYYDLALSGYCSGVKVILRVRCYRKDGEIRIT